MEFFIQKASLAASVATMYSASVDDKLTVCCLCDAQEIGTHPVVERMEWGWDQSSNQTGVTSHKVVLLRLVIFNDQSFNDSLGI